MSYNYQCCYFDEGREYVEVNILEQTRPVSCTLPGYEHTDPNCENCGVFEGSQPTHDSSL